MDTSIFDRYGCNLEFKVLGALNQFEHGPIRVLISEIVANEVTSHIARDAEKTQRDLNNALKEQAKRWKLKTDIKSLNAELSLHGDARAAAEEQLNEYLAAVNGELVPAAGPEGATKELLDRYFATKPPFEAKTAKKNEFPDAFALLSLERIGREHKKYVLCVTSDKGWKNFCETSDFVVYADDLEVALSHFNDTGRVTADNTVAMLQQGNAAELKNAIDSAFEYHLDGLDFYPEGTAPLYFEGYPESAVMQYLDMKTAGAPIVIAADEEEVTFSWTISALISFEAEFSFSVDNDIDNDYVNLGSQTYETEEMVTATLVITVLRDLEDEPQVVDVEVSVRVSEIDFGYVEPFPGEDPTHEKY